ncbi:MAG: hypothetical protein MI919_42130, partial [Holophagales bacterium]|nr:hypothetical protein [Holophagales bacterium]
ALSATVKPMEVVAEFLGGYELIPPAGADPGTEPIYRPRPVTLLRSKAEKVYDVRVRFPVELDPESELDDDSMWEMLTRDFRKVIAKNRSTLLFANSRRTTEKATRLLNLEAGQDLAYSHHGSLSREVRSVVEKRLKGGELKAIVATNSLELGIDVGDLDEVLLNQTPPSVASAVQRIGRAGHGVGQVSRGRFYPTHGRDLLESAVVARSVMEQEIEEIHPITAPLDVLAQVILSMVVAETRGVDELFHRLRASWPYRRLSRRQYDLVLEMLAGRYAETRIRELLPRVHLDKVRGTVKARTGVARLLYMSGGTIADRGYFTLRLDDGSAKIGELDEEFVWERSIGDSFVLGTQSWQIRRITHNDVLVAPGRGPAGIAPFWRADARDRSFALCQRVAAFLERAERRLKSKDFRHELEERWCLEPKAAEELLRFLDEQRSCTGGKLPRRDRILVERTGGPTGGAASRLLLLHTFWGGAVNRPLALALQAAWDERYPDPLEIFHDDGSLLARVPEDVTPTELLALVPPEQVEELLRQRLEGSGFFGARFRWAAGTALLLPRAGFRQRTPLWLSRQRSKKLLDTVRGHGDFPAVVEAWRSCLQDEFELHRLKEVLTRVREGEIAFAEVRTERPSPLAAGLMWQHTNQLMYEDDTPISSQRTGLRLDILSELVHASHLRPRLPPALAERFRRKAQRLERGYAPAPGDELGLWLHERLRVPAGEW